MTLLAGRLDIVVAATDHNSQGEAYADRLRQIAVAHDCDFQRLRPIAGDWNEDLQHRREEKEEWKDMPHGGLPRQGQGSARWRDP